MITNTQVDLKRRDKIKGFLGIVAGTFLVKILGVDMLGRSLDSDIGKNANGTIRKELKKLNKSFQEQKIAIKQEYKQKLVSLQKKRIEKDYALARQREFENSEITSREEIAKIAKARRLENIEITRKRKLEDVELSIEKDRKLKGLNVSYKISKVELKKRRV